MKRKGKSSRDSEFKRRPTYAQPWPEQTAPHRAGSSSSGPSSRQSAVHGSPSHEYDQRKAHWDTVLDRSSPPYHRSDRSTPLTSQHPHNLSPNSSQNSSSHRGGHSSQSSRSSTRAVPIAPSGPLVNPLEEDDGCRFECPEEGCQQKFRHRSSRSRHKRLSHPRSVAKGSHTNR